jgi:hypothetical protein
VNINHTNTDVNAALAPITPDNTPAPFMDYDMRERLKSEGGELFWNFDNSEKDRIRGAEMVCLGEFARSLERRPEGHPSFAQYVRERNSQQAELLRDKYGPFEAGGVDNESSQWSPDD